jgi:DNA-binding MarR family transcriptional regulator
VDRALDAQESAAWDGLLRTHKFLMQLMSQQLEAHHGLALNSYDVLRHLALANDTRLIMHQLAERVMITRSGLSGVVARLESDGLIQRDPDAVDGRGLYAQLTPAGWLLLRGANATITACIRKQFLAPLDPDDLAASSQVWRKLGHSVDVRQ